MAKKKHEAVESSNTEKPEPKEPKAEKGYTVLDSNGKAVRVVKAEEEAKALAEVYGGRVQP